MRDSRDTLVSVVDYDADIAEIKESLESFRQAVEIFDQRIVNLANQLEDHMHKPDAHNPGILRKK